MCGESCLSFPFETFVVEFVPGFAWVRCVIGNGESGVIISDLTLDQCFYTHKEEVPYGVSCFNVLSWT